MAAKRKKSARICDGFESPLAIIRKDRLAETWEVLAPLIYKDQLDKMFVVPQGFITDFASLPPFVRGWISRTGLSVEPAVLHDFLYSPDSPVSREEADLLFLETLLRSGIGFIKAQTMYRAVRLAGGKYYHGRRQRKDRGGSSR